MSAEQGDVEAIREALKLATWEPTWLFPRAIAADAALDRLAAAKKACERQYQEKVNQLLQVTVALERAERERDEAYRKDKSRRHLAARAEKAEQERDTYKQDYLTRHERWRDAEARAEKAERALAENEQAWEDMRAYNIRLEERAREAERALGEIAQLGQPMSGLETAWTCAEIARAALRPSEEVSDES